MNRARVQLMPPGFEYRYEVGGAMFVSILDAIYWCRVVNRELRAAT